MRYWLAASVVLLCASCDGTNAPSPQTAHRPAQVEEDKVLGGLTLQVEAEGEIRGDRPRLYVSCSGSPMLSFDVVTPPSSIPPLAGVQSHIEVDREGWDAEWSIADPKSAFWTLRDQTLGAALARAILKASEVRVRPPADFAPAQTIIWMIDLSDNDRRKMIGQCE